MRARKLGTMVLIAVCAAGGLWLFAAVLFPLLLPLFIGLAVAAIARKPVSWSAGRSSPGDLLRFCACWGSTRWRGRGFSFCAGSFAGRSAVFSISCRSLPQDWKSPRRPCRTDSTPSRTNFRTAWAPVFAQGSQAFLKAARDLAQSSMNGFLRLRPGFLESFRIWCSAR